MPMLVVGAAALLVVAYLLFRLVKFTAGLAVNAVLGVIVYIGAAVFGAPIAVTPVSLLVAIVLGIPGAVVMVLVSLTGFPLVT